MQQVDKEYITPRLDANGRVIKETSELRLEKNVKESLLSGAKKSKNQLSHYSSGVDMRET